MEYENQAVLIAVETTLTPSSYPTAARWSVSLCGTDGVSETPVVPERTGMASRSGCTVLQPSAEEAVIAGGGVYKGIQRGSSRIPDLVLFNDPATGTTLALVSDGRPITARTIQAKIARSRARFAEYGRY
jgi:hypothetical protein